MDAFDRRLAAYRKRRDAEAAKPDPYQCAWCGERYVVQTLARLCEEKHR